MGSNRLFAALKCPRCGSTSEAEVEAAIDEQGHAHDYRVGDVVDWLSGRRPPNGTKTLDGYVVCPACGKDFFVSVKIVNDRVAGIDVDEGRPGYIQ